MTRATVSSAGDYVAATETRSNLGNVHRTLLLCQFVRSNANVPVFIVFVTVSVCFKSYLLDIRFLDF